MTTRYDMDSVRTIGSVEVVEGITDKGGDVLAFNMKQGRKFLPVHVLDVKFCTTTGDVAQLQRDVAALAKAGAFDELMQALKGCTPYAANVGARCYISANEGLTDAMIEELILAKYGSAPKAGAALSKLDIASATRKATERKLAAESAKQAQRNVANMTRAEIEATLKAMQAQLDTMQ